ncbi:histidine kinase [Vibrio cholerae]|nr:histidine kinase [Vibrio cholerae]EGR0580103.1 histidine kinase [Vibrio cholerae]EGR0616709.1 histidine kinase [Vibrio cholerae]EGR1092390.1 histidine kinase [Vibrio cholerae]EGR1700927.1 histidine kinase [Vibrio cholerae]
MKSVMDKLVLNITVFEQEKSIKKNIREKTAQTRCAVDLIA